MNYLTLNLNSGIRGQFKLNQLDRNDPVERVMYDNRRLEAIAQAQPSSANKVKVRKRNSAVSAAEKRCLWGC